MPVRLDPFTRIASYHCVIDYYDVDTDSDFCLAIVSNQLVFIYGNASLVVFSITNNDITTWKNNISWPNVAIGCGNAPNIDPNAQWGSFPPDGGDTEEYKSGSFYGYGGNNPSSTVPSNYYYNNNNIYCDYTFNVSIWEVQWNTNPPSPLVSEYFIYNVPDQVIHQSFCLSLSECISGATTGHQCGATSPNMNPKNITFLGHNFTASRLNSSTVRISRIS